MCVYVNKSDAADTQAEPSLPSEPQGVRDFEHVLEIASI